MIAVPSYPVAIALCVITMLCWGSWANTRKLAGAQWRFEVFYWDYVFGVMLLVLQVAFTFGSIGDVGRRFLDDLGQADWLSLGSAALGGVVFNAANLLLVAAIDIAGMAVAFPVGIGLALIVGVALNYWSRPEGNAVLLFLGVALIAVAIVLDALAYRRLPGQSRGLSSKGLILSVLCGLLMGSFYWFVAWSMSKDPLLLESGKLGPYAAVCLFACGVLGSNLIFNQVLMARPFEGPPVTWSDYFAGTARQHLLGLAGGAIWALGMICNLLAAGKTSPAVSYGLGQGATMVAALWGVLVWREFRLASRGVRVLLALMFVAYIGGLSLVTFTKAGESLPHELAQADRAAICVATGEPDAETMATEATAATAPDMPEEVERHEAIQEPDVIYVPTPYAVVRKMLELADVTKTDVVYDLGCGDGRIVATAARKYGCRCVGFDIDPARIQDSREKVAEYEVGDLVTIEQQDIFQIDMSKASVVMLYLLPDLNVRLIPQLEQLKPGSRIVSHDFDMTGVSPDQAVEVTEPGGRKHMVYLWTTPLKKQPTL
jgi:glucose uptake protein